MAARFSEDEYPGEDRAVYVTNEGQPLVLPASARRLDRDSAELLASIQRLALDAARLESELAELTRIGREMGISWNLLAVAQGLTGEGLRRRMQQAEEEDG